MELFKQIIHVDFIALVTFIYLALFMRSNRAYDKSVNKYYLYSLLLVAVLTITDNLDYYYSGLSEPHKIHKIFIMAGYITRVFLLMSAVYILKRDTLTKRVRLLLLAPALINVAVILSAFFTDKVFWIDENNVLHRELLSYTPHVTSLTYFFITLGISIKRYRQGYKDEGRMLFISLAAVMTGVISEIVLKTRGVLISAVLLMLAFYYLYLHMEHFKRDNLTGVLNRMSFFADIEDTQKGTITALCEIDMNGLKQINDSEGHEAGDRAIKAVSAIILKCIPNSSHLYRLGGDEFAVLFRNIDMA
ncbi:MAG: GGDEF domain-containing protein [Ruminococcus sp.]|nr:GGDEF domain-containing protein [Ruminococcus sp.]